MWPLLSYPNLDTHSAIVEGYSDNRMCVFYPEELYIYLCSERKLSERFQIYILQRQRDMTPNLRFSQVFCDVTSHCSVNTYRSFEGQNAFIFRAKQSIQKTS